MWAPVTQLSEAVPQGLHQAGNEELSRRDFIRLAVDQSDVASATGPKVGKLLKIFF